MSPAFPKTLLSPVAAVVVLSVGGCAATQMAIEHRQLDVRTQMSSTIFLKPVPASDHTVYVQIRNTSDQNIDTDSLSRELERSLTAKGMVAGSFDHAHYFLQANILQVGKMDVAAAASVLNAGFGGALTGAALAGAAGTSYRGVAGAAAAGGLIDLVAGALVKNVTYTAITDVQITEKGSGPNGAPGVAQTRMLSTANQTNLEFQDALPKLREQIIHSLAGMF